MPGQQKRNRLAVLSPVSDAPHRHTLARQGILGSLLLATRHSPIPRDSEQQAEIDMRLSGSASHVVFCALRKTNAKPYLFGMRRLADRVPTRRDHAGRAEE